MTDLYGIASDLLVAGGYRQVTDAGELGQLGPNARLFEDPYCIVAVMVYETWPELASGWTEAQSALVEVISRHISSSEAKAWDGYLVLLTPGLMGTESVGTANEIRYDTSRLRKLVASGDELRGISDVERAFLPLLPLHEVELAEAESALAMLPSLLGPKGVPEDAVHALIEAFTEQTSLLERLHKHRSGQ